MGVADIIKELPKLTEADRRAIRELLLEIVNQDPDIALCNEAALEGAMLLDRMENEDAKDEGRRAFFPLLLGRKGQGERRPFSQMIDFGMAAKLRSAFFATE